MKSKYDLIVKNAIIDGHQGTVDIAVLNGIIVEIGRFSQDSSYKVYDASYQFVSIGFYESHIHLDKACILDRCSIEKGTLEEAVTETGKAKENFTKEDVFNRASNVIEMAIKKGTLGMRTFVETDTKTQLRSFEAIKKAKEKYQFAIDIEICAFAQEGLTEDKETHLLIKKALESGADLIGGCPYKDKNPDKHIEMIFEIAKEYDVDVDFHLDFDLDPKNSSIPKVVEETLKHNYQNRVSIGHVTKLAAMSREQRKEMALLLKKGGITLTVLPATDLFLNGRNIDRLVPRGMVNANEFISYKINTTISSNNILNAFTPYGDASLLRMANYYANLAQLAKDEDIKEAYHMITKNAARLLSKQTKLQVGSAADFVILESKSATEAIRMVAQPLAGFKNGLQTFNNERAVIVFPD